MDREELLQLLREAQEAIAQGMPRAEVESLLQRDFGFEGITGLATAAFAPSPEEAAREGATQRVAGRSPVSNFLRSFAQGLSFGSADELVGLGPLGLARLASGAATGTLPQTVAQLSADPAVQQRTGESRQRVEDLRTAAPGAAFASELAGGLALPIGAGGGSAAARIVGQAPTRLARAGRAAGLGAAGGAATGGVTGLFEEGPGGVVPGAAIGAAAGGTLGAAAGAATRAARPVGTDVAQSLVQRTGRQPGTIPAGRAIKAELRNISETMFAPLEEQFPEIVTPRVMAALSSKDDVVAGTLRRALPKAVRGGKRPPSFREAQSALQDLRDKAFATRRDPADSRAYRRAADRLEDAMSDEVPGFSEVNAQWALTKARERALAQGEKMFDARPEKVQAALEALPSEEAREAFRVGSLTRWHDNLSRGGQMSKQQLERLRATGNADRLRLLFDDGPNGQRAFDSFMDDIERFGRAAADDKQLVGGRRLGRLLLFGGVVGLGGGTVVAERKGLFGR